MLNKFLLIAAYALMPGCRTAPPSSDFLLSETIEYPDGTTLTRVYSGSISPEQALARNRVDIAKDTPKQIDPP